MIIANKTIVITGGASGLGAATARYFAEKGARIAILDMNEEAGNMLVKELNQAMFIRCNITSEQQVTTAIEKITVQFDTIHICINCAGVPAPAKILDRDGKATPLEKFERTVQINLIGTFNVMSQCAAVMATNTPENEEERGVVINVASAAAYEGQIGQCGYASSKNGVIGLNLPAARELVTAGIRVNAIAPGLFATPMVKSLGEKVVASLIDMIEAPKRFGELEEFAHCCAFIIENAYVNGETIRLDAATRLRAR